MLANLFRLEWWLRHRNYADPPDVGGVWGEIIAQIVRLHRRKRFHKQRFVQLMRQLQRSTAALPDGVVILNAQREIVWFNRMAARLLNLRRTADLGMRIENLLRAAGVRALPRRPGLLQPGGRAHRRRGEDGFLSLQVAPYGDGQLLLLVRDVSRQMRLEAVRRDFVANASHELRSPLTVISGYLETLAQDPVLDAELTGPVAEMRRQAERMTAIIRDLIELSRLEETDEVVGGEPVDVAALRRAAAQGRAGAARASAGRARAGRVAARSCSAMNRRSTPRSPIWSTTPRSTPAPRARSRSAGGWMRMAVTSPSATPASAFRPSTSRDSPSASTGWMPGARAPPAARAWDWRSSSTCCSGTGRRWKCRARSAPAAPSPAISRPSASPPAVRPYRRATA